MEVAQSIHRIEEKVKGRKNLIYLSPAHVFRLFTPLTFVNTNGFWIPNHRRISIRFVISIVIALCLKKKKQKKLI